MKLNGFTIIEAIVGMAIFLIVSGSLFGITQLIFENIGQTRVRHTARLLANEKIEEAKNLSYNDLGTVGGVPAGPIKMAQVVSLGGLDFKVTTNVVYIDDPFDNKAPADIVSTDYKRVRVKVEWKGAFTSGKRPIILVTDVAPKSIESNVGGGTLSLLVFNSLGSPLLGADVHIVNTSVDPDIDLTLNTDSFGRIILPGAPESVESYQITVSKDGYSTDRTYSVFEVTNPAKPHITVLEGQVSEAGFAIDRISKLVVNTRGSRGSGFEALANVDLSVYGEKIIGTNTDEELVYKFDELVTTDSNGTYTFLSMEFDSYFVKIMDTSYDLAGSNPSIPVSLEAGETLELDLSLLVDSPGGSLLVLVADGGGGPLSSASARLVNSQLGYDKEIITGDMTDPDFGHAFFNNLNATGYQLTISLPDYDVATASVQINNDVFIKINISHK